MFYSIFPELIAISFFLILLASFLIKNYSRIGLNIFLDKDFKKPQSFHKEAILNIGGIIIFFYFLFSFFFFYKNIILKDLLLMLIPLFFFSILEDLKFRINPQLRLLLLFLIIFFIVYFFNLNIYSVQFYHLDILLNKNKIFAILFITFSIVFIINGSNFIDGFNGLLVIHAIIIVSFLVPIYFIYNQKDLLEVSILFINFFLFFFFFNFPKARIFLGNSGSYLIGFIISFLVIKASEVTYYHKIYPFYFAILLYFLFFEVFFSFFRKMIFEEKNPLLPDKKHLHMLLYYNLKSNYKTSILLNIYFFISILPILYFKNYPGLLKVYFVVVLFFYIIFYLKLLKKK